MGRRMFKEVAPTLSFSPGVGNLRPAGQMRPAWKIQYGPHQKFHCPSYSTTSFQNETPWQEDT